jgi:hypothetical protein
LVVALAGRTRASLENRSVENATTIRLGAVVESALLEVITHDGLTYARTERSAAIGLRASSIIVALAVRGFWRDETRAECAVDGFARTDGNVEAVVVA